MTGSALLLAVCRIAGGGLCGRPCTAGPRLLGLQPDAGQVAVGKVVCICTLGRIGEEGQAK